MKSTTLEPYKVNKKNEKSAGFRADIQGMRAVAVAMVVIYHLYPSALPGGFTGVDVFFVISGYLITGRLWRGYAETGKVRLADFWGRRARRLVPAAALVLTVTWIMSRIVEPASQLANTAQQILASALYFQNWELSADAVNYLKSDDAASPVQHFWSLSVEEQFYIVWPLLFLLAAFLAAVITPRRAGAGQEAADARRTRARGYAVSAATTMLVIASLIYSVHETYVSPAAAYFVTTTRMWELGVGGLLALAPAGLTRFLSRQGWLGWLGLATIVASAFLLSGSMAFPGALALLPVLGAAALIAGGSAEGKHGPSRLMSARVMVFIGGISYSVYLWHYPIINLYTSWRGKAPGLLTGPLIVAVTVLLAWLTRKYVEDTVRLAPFVALHKWRSLSTALCAVLPVALAAVFIVTLPATPNGPLGPGYPGAAVLADPWTPVPSEPVLPAPAAVKVPGYWAQGCLVDPETATSKPCVFGDTKNPKLTVALVGDSIAGNWWAALDEIADQEHWKLVTDLHSVCPWSATPMIDPSTGRAYTACDSWGQAAMNDLLTKIHPQIVITSSLPTVTSQAHPSGGPASNADIGAGEATYWKELKAHGISVVAITETPMLPVNMADCVSKNGPASAKCDIPVATAIVRDPPTSYAARDMSGTVPVIDMNDLICTSAYCPGVVGNVLVYFDDHHFTESYSDTLAPYLKQRLLATGVIPRS